MAIIIILPCSCVIVQYPLEKIESHLLDPPLESDQPPVSCLIDYVSHARLTDSSENGLGRSMGGVDRLCYTCTNQPVSMNLREAVT